MTDELVKRLREIGKFSFGWTADQAADRIEALKANYEILWETNLRIGIERNQLREALEQIEITCEEEICARTAGMSEAALGKSRILPLLQIPRNIARAALKGETP